jgi:uncharacterized membrane protein
MSDDPRAAGRAARRSRLPGLDTPLEARRGVLPTTRVDPEVFGRWSERFARFMGTARFLAYMTGFVTLWLAWNTFTPPGLQFDPRALNYTLLTLLLSLQASYAAPLILLAQNRQADRDRVSFEQDRQRAERSLADTEYLAREVAALRIALRDVATRDFVRSELRDLVDEVVAELTADPAGEQPGDRPGGKAKKAGKKPGKLARPAAPSAQTPPEPARAPADEPASPADPVAADPVAAEPTS